MDQASTAPAPAAVLTARLAGACDLDQLVACVGAPDAHPLGQLCAMALQLFDDEHACKVLWEASDEAVLSWLTAICGHVEARLTLDELLDFTVATDVCRLFALLALHDGKTDSARLRQRIDAFSALLERLFDDAEPLTAGGELAILYHYLRYVSATSSFRMSEDIRPLRYISGVSLDIARFVADAHCTRATPCRPSAYVLGTAALVVDLASALEQVHDDLRAWGYRPWWNGQRHFKQLLDHLVYPAKQSVALRAALSRLTDTIQADPASDYPLRVDANYVAKKGTVLAPARLDWDSGLPLRDLLRLLLLEDLDASQAAALAFAGHAIDALLAASPHPAGVLLALCHLRDWQTVELLRVANRGRWLGLLNDDARAKLAANTPSFLSASVMGPFTFFRQYMYGEMNDWPPNLYGYLVTAYWLDHGSQANANDMRVIDADIEFLVDVPINQLLANEIALGAANPLAVLDCLLGIWSEKNSYRWRSLLGDKKHLYHASVFKGFRHQSSSAYFAKAPRPLRRRWKQLVARHIQARLRAGTAGLIAELAQHVNALVWLGLDPRSVCQHEGDGPLPPLEHYRCLDLLYRRRRCWRARQDRRLALLMRHPDALAERYALDLSTLANQVSFRPSDVAAYVLPALHLKPIGELVAEHFIRLEHIACDSAIAMQEALAARAAPPAWTWRTLLYRYCIEYKFDQPELLQLLERNKDATRDAIELVLASRRADLDHEPRAEGLVNIYTKRRYELRSERDRRPLAYCADAMGRQALERIDPALPDAVHRLMVQRLRADRAGYHDLAGLCEALGTEFGGGYALARMYGAGSYSALDDEEAPTAPDIMAVRAWLGYFSTGLLRQTHEQRALLLRASRLAQTLAIERVRRDVRQHFLAASFADTLMPRLIQRMRPLDATIERLAGSLGVQAGDALWERDTALASLGISWLRRAFNPWKYYRLAQAVQARRRLDADAGRALAPLVQPYLRSVCLKVVSRWQVQSPALAHVHDADIDCRFLLLLCLQHGGYPPGALLAMLDSDEHAKQLRAAMAASPAWTNWPAVRTLHRVVFEAAYYDMQGAARWLLNGDAGLAENLFDSDTHWDTDRLDTLMRLDMLADGAARAPLLRCLQAAMTAERDVAAHDPHLRGDHPPPVAALLANPTAALADALCASAWLRHRPRDQRAGAAAQMQSVELAIRDVLESLVAEESRLLDQRFTAWHGVAVKQALRRRQLESLWTLLDYPRLLVTPLPRARSRQLEHCPLAELEAAERSALNHVWEVWYKVKERGADHADLGKDWSPLEVWLDIAERQVGLDVVDAPQRLHAMFARRPQLGALIQLFIEDGQVWALQAGAGTAGLQLQHCGVMAPSTLQSMLRAWTDALSCAGQGNSAALEAACASLRLVNGLGALAAALDLIANGRAIALILPPELSPFPWEALLGVPMQRCGSLAEWCRVDFSTPAAGCVVATCAATTATVSAGAEQACTLSRMLPVAPDARALDLGRHLTRGAILPKLDAKWIHLLFHGVASGRLVGSGLDARLDFRQGQPAAGDARQPGGLPAWLLACADLPGSVVFLSSCEAGLVLARDNPLLDRFGLAPALMAAGARAIIAPLWSVDQACHLLFTDTYYRIATMHTDLPLLLVLERARAELAALRLPELEDRLRQLATNVPERQKLLASLRLAYGAEGAPTTCWFAYALYGDGSLSLRDALAALPDEPYVHDAEACAAL